MEEETQRRHKKANDDTSSLRTEPRKDTPTPPAEASPAAAPDASSNDNDSHLEGLPSGWVIEWEGGDAKKKRRVWSFPINKVKVDSKPKALMHSIEWGLISNTLSPSSRQKAKQLARKQGLPSQWEPFLDSDARTKWHHQDAEASSISKALELNYDMGLLEHKQNTANQQSAATTTNTKMNTPDDTTMNMATPKSIEKKRKRSSFDAIKSMEEARIKGLPEGWEVEWNAETNKRKWIAPDRRNFSTLTQALCHVKACLNGHDRILTRQEVEAAMKLAKSRGLPPGWNVVWDVTNKSKKWIAPNGRVATTLPKAIAMSKSMGLIATIQQHEHKKRVLTYEEKCAALAEASARGLPDGWQVEWNNENHQRKWIAPDKKTTCGTIPQAIALSIKNKWISADRVPSPSKDKDGPPTAAQLDAKLKLAQTKGLGPGWRCTWDTSTQRSKWQSPEGHSFRTLPQALSYSCKSSTSRVLTSDEKQKALAEAEAKGLPQGWSVSWDNNNGSKKWIAPDGRIATSLPKALAISEKMGLLQSSSSSPKAERQLTQEEVTAALLEANNRGLPDGWKVVWDNQQQMRRWISPKSGTKCNSIPLALARSVKEGLLPPNFQVPKGRTRTLAHDVGLPKGWSCLYNAKAKRRKWRSPAGTKLCRSIPEALAYSIELGLLPTSTPIARPRRNSFLPKETKQKSSKVTTAAANILIDTTAINSTGEAVPRRESV
jgi:hypothetical protein